MAHHSAHAVSLLADPAGEMEPVLLHRCRGGRAPYDWRATATVGRFVCLGCGIVGACGACAEMCGQRIPPGVVPALCAFHGGLLEIGITDMALAVDSPAPVTPRSKTVWARQSQLAPLPWVDAEYGKEQAEPTNRADATTQ
jgi:hypothetical protein